MKNSLILIAVALMIFGCDDAAEVPTDSGLSRVRDSGRGLGNFDMFVLGQPDLGDLSMDAGTSGEDGNLAGDAGAMGDMFLGDAENRDTAPLMDPDAAEPMDDAVFTPGLPGVLARYELNGDVNDSSGNERLIQRLGGVFMPSDFGQGLMVNDLSHGLDWSAHATLLNHPFSIEMVFTPMRVDGQSFAKIFDTNGMTETGWYVQSRGFRNWPSENDPIIARGSIPDGERVYLAVVSASDNTIHVYINGERETNQPIGARFEATPPAQALFFKDDGRVSMNEEPHALIEALRISSVNRSANEIADVQARLAPSE